MLDFLNEKKNDADFPGVDSIEKAADAGRTGALMPMLLMPDCLVER